LLVDILPGQGEIVNYKRVNHQILVYGNTAQYGGTLGGVFSASHLMWFS
jgi:hypothetical protein